MLEVPPRFNCIVAIPGSISSDGSAMNFPTRLLFAFLRPRFKFQKHYLQPCDVIFLFFLFIHALHIALSMLCGFGAIFQTHTANVRQALSLKPSSSAVLLIRCQSAPILLPAHRSRTHASLGEHWRQPSVAAQTVLAWQPSVVECVHVDHCFGLYHDWCLRFVFHPPLARHRQLELLYHGAAQGSLQR